MSNERGDLQQSTSGVISDIKSAAQRKLKEIPQAPALDRATPDDMVNKESAAEIARKAGREAVRNQIARITSYFFFPFVAALILLIFFVYYLFPDDAKDISDHMTGIAKDMILPVVTLILGYFFGSSSER